MSFIKENKGFITCCALTKAIQRHLLIDWRGVLNADHSCTKIGGHFYNQLQNCSATPRSSALFSLLVNEVTPQQSCLIMNAISIR